jgi:hypothetical protein
MIRLTIALSPLLALAACGGGDTSREGGEEVAIVGNTEDTVVPRAAPAVNAAAPADTAPGAAVNLAPDGLSIVLDSGAARHVPFGTAREAATRMIAAVAGNPIEQGDNQECGAGALSFASFRGGLGLYFQDGQFAGWDLDGREGGRFSSGTGIGIGSTRQQLDAAGPTTVEDSTLGIEFQAGGLSGLLSSREPGGEVTNLWAGMTCIAR